MKTRVYVTVSALIFMLMAVVHLLRLAEGWPIVVGSFSFPLWASIIAILVMAGVGLWGLSLLRRRF